MKRYNSLYIVGFLMVCLLLYMAKNIQSESAFFYGFAENKQTEISHNQDVQISKIHVKNGQEVKKGDLLLEVMDQEIGVKVQGLEIEKEVVQVDNSSKIIEIQNKINQITSESQSKIIELESEIRELEAEIEINKSLFEGLKTIQKKENKYQSPDLEKLSFLKENLENVRTIRDRQIQEQRRILSSIHRPSDLKSKGINAKLDHLKMKEGQLSIYAPFDGLVGTVSCKEGENISSFSSLLDLYKHNPTQVKGFVHESMLLEVAVGDKLEVASTLHPDIKIVGEVVGLGSRIVEIPERLRKVVDFKSYGREVVIEIPVDNIFLQKEKVMLNLLEERPNEKPLGNTISSSKESSSISKSRNKVN